MKNNPKCMAFLEFGDDAGDNVCTMRCQLLSGHIGNHVETGRQAGCPYTVTWSGGELMSLNRQQESAMDSAGGTP